MYALNENLAYSLQFSRLRTTKQTQASKQLLSSELEAILPCSKSLKSILD